MTAPEPFTDPEAIDRMEAEHRPLWSAFVRSFSPLLFPGARVLDFGCSGGGLLRLLFERQTEGAIPEIALAAGIDVDEPAMRTVLARAAGRPPRDLPIVFTTGRLAAFPEQFDLVVSHEVVYLLPDLRETFAEIRAALRDQGHFCFTTGCHTDNPLFARWRRSLEAEGVAVHARAADAYERALRDAGFIEIRDDRLRLREEEYAAWAAARGTAQPNPAWFASSAEERDYYVRTGKLLLTAQRG
ncbi:MAG: class I SAM-dependent methyltransferase [Candidatus Eisenbacteria bacterium]|nr:class I SAM-dependent methyltransferase [Candidatus Eisenbacteria bacterium]